MTRSLGHCSSDRKRDCTSGVIWRSLTPVAVDSRAAGFKRCHGLDPYFKYEAGSTHRQSGANHPKIMGLMQSTPKGHFGMEPLE